MTKLSLLLVASVFVHTAGHAQVNLSAAAAPIVRALVADGYTAGTVIVAAAPNCQRALNDPSCERTQYPLRRQADAASMAAAMAEVLNLQSSPDLDAAKRQLLVIRAYSGPESACFADGNFVRTVLAGAPIVEADGQTIRVGVSLQQLPMLEGCRGVGRLIEFTVRRRGADGAYELVEKRLMHTGTSVRVRRG